MSGAALCPQCSNRVHVPGFWVGSRKMLMRPKSICREHLHLAGDSGKSDMEGRGSSLGPDTDS